MSLRAYEDVSIYELGKDIVANVFPSFHIGGIASILHAMNAGATLILVPKFEFEQFLKLIETYKVKYINIIMSLPL